MIFLPIYLFIFSLIIIIITVRFLIILKSIKFICFPFAWRKPVRKQIIVGAKSSLIFRNGYPGMW